MAERLDALCVRENNGKSYFTKIGAAFPNKDGKGWSILLDAMPAPTDGQFKIMLREPLPKDGARGGNDQRQDNRRDASRDSFDDSIPFITNSPELEWRIS